MLTHDRSSNKHVRCLHSTLWERQDKSIALNGVIHWLSEDTPCLDASSTVAYDFYGGRHDDGECRIIHFPGRETDKVTGYGKADELRRFRRNFTASEGSIVYFNEFNENGSDTLRVWKLVKYEDCPEAWQLSWDLKLTSLTESGIDYFPVVMHPLNSEIIYLWSRKVKGLVLFNLRTRVFSIHKEIEECMDGCILIFFNGCGEYMDDIRSYYLPWYQDGPNNLFFHICSPSLAAPSPSSSAYLPSLMSNLMVEDIRFQVSIRTNLSIEKPHPPGLRFQLQIKLPSKNGLHINLVHDYVMSVSRELGQCSTCKAVTFSGCSRDNTPITNEIMKLFPRTRKQKPSLKGVICFFSLCFGRIQFGYLIQISNIILQCHQSKSNNIFTFEPLRQLPAP